MTTQAPKWKPMAVFSGGARSRRRPAGNSATSTISSPAITSTRPAGAICRRKQVVSRTLDAGARGSFAGQTLNWSVDLFHTVNSNDIQFIATTTSQGYFDNVGNTRRQGVDLALGGKLARLRWHAVYSFVDATYQSNFLLNGESNSTADENGDIQVTSGNRIPLIPRHTGRLMLDYARRNSRRVLELARSTLRYLSAAKRTCAAR